MTLLSLFGEGEILNCVTRASTRQKNRKKQIRTVPVCIGHYLEVKILQKIYKIDIVGADSRELTSDALSTFLNSKRGFLFGGSSTSTGNLEFIFYSRDASAQNR